MANREPIGGFILAGGRSSRMGRAKGLLAFGGEPLVVHAARLLEFVSEPRITPIIIGPPDVYANHGIRVVPDDGENLGPLGGISTALRIATCEWNLIVGCDLPFLTREWLEFLVAQTAASSADGLATLTLASIAPAEWKAFDPCGRLFKNVNTPEDYDEARESLGEKAAS